ncbi:glycosyltransferase family 4 protein [Pedobacter changchengzhani]|uniref:Glycosyltransferase family 4 protein n=1 Tax=Pedobacter changchengzhani TaxID=2529274 RepID=A0A4R5MPE5_9SPHI|nr:glycosyltransferase family 4 protein [Pedobacter changchengzhani]TDG37727.1 glycosyltransferase family 4 protein [Pedobacter changchengzhani]
MSIIFALSILTCLFLAMLVYFKIASHYNIVDKPNHRSSHSKITIRGGGVIFMLSLIIFYIYSNYQYAYFILGAFLISSISFLDDVFTLNNKVRLSIHLVASILLLVDLGIFDLEWYWILLILFIILAIINAYNFMDGINGITGVYSLVTILTLLYINNSVRNFTSNDLLIIVGLSLLVFNFFNFRKRAKCFAGDVGSISIAFILIFLIGQLILKTDQYEYILLLLFYGLDTSTTILFRIIRKENIGQAHRTHFYQYLANKLKLPHLSVSSLYALAQIISNLILILLLKSTLSLFLYVCVSGIIFISLRFYLEGKSILLEPTLGKKNFDKS